VSKEHCSAISRQKFNPKTYNLLIIEDSKSFNKILTAEFTKDGFNCFSVTTLKDAYETIQNNKIHYLLLDINLPDGNGYELIKKLENTPEKIFVLTSENDKQFQEVSYQRGVIDYIVKDKSFFHKIHQITKTIEQLEKNKTKTILVVDDSFVIQEQLKEILSNRYYHVEIASNEIIALEMIKNKKIDMMFLDVQLGKANGIRFLEKNHQLIVDIQKIATIIISGNVDVSVVRDGLKAGAVDIIRKPYVIEEIVLKADLWIDYKRREEEILCSSKILEEYKDAVDESSIVSKATPAGIITYVNKKFCELSGYKEEELLGKNHNIVRHPDMGKGLYANMWYTIKELKQTWKGKVKNRKKDGSYYWVDAIIKPIINANGEIEEFIGLRNDITQEKEIEEYFHSKFEGTKAELSVAMKTAQEYENAINESNILSRSNLKGKITYVNDKFVEITGYSKEEIIGKNHSILKHPDTPKEIIKNLWDTIKAGNIFQTILKNKTKAGDTYWVNSTIVPIRNEADEIVEYMAIRHDLTELFQLHEEIENTQKDVIYKMGEIGETRSKETRNHVKRVAEYSKLLALSYGLCEHEANILFTASPMHDIGKVGIPDSILKKPAKLTYEEFEVMKSHTDIGYNVLKGSNREVLNAASIVSHEHHEKWDGTGYPRGLKGEEIHIYGRITAIADVFDALGSQRCYKEAWDDKRIFALFKEERGKQFDPKLVDLFFAHKDNFLQIRNTYKD